MFWTICLKVACTRALNVVSLYGKVGYFPRKKPKISLTKICLMYFPDLRPYPIETISPGHSLQTGLIRQKSETFCSYSM